MLRKSRLILIAVAVALIAGGVAVWQVNSPVGNLAGTATTPCAPTSTHWCAPSYIKDSPGEAEWTNTAAVKFTNNNNDGKKNTINWWASHGKYTSSTFSFEIGNNKTESLAFPCAIDHLYADNKGPANTVATSTGMAVDNPVNAHEPDGRTFNWIDDDTLSVEFNGVKVLTVKNTSGSISATIHWAWEIAGPDNAEIYWDYGDYPASFSKKSKIELGPGKTMKIVLPCAANLTIFNGKLYEDNANLEIVQLL